MGQYFLDRQYIYITDKLSKQHRNKTSLIFFPNIRPALNQSQISRTTGYHDEILKSIREKNSKGVLC